MTSRNVLNKAVAGVVIAGAMLLTSVFSGVASADTGINIGVGELQEFTFSKSMPADGNVDGRDFLLWQRGSTTHSQSVGGSDLADWQANYGIRY